MAHMRALRLRRRDDFGKVFPRDKNETLVFQEFLKFGIADQVEVVLAPLRAPVRVIKGGALDFGVVVGEMNDELVGARGKRLQHFLVGVEPLRLWDAWAAYLGIEPGDRALPRAVSAYADAFTDAFWQEAERTARDHLG